MSEAKSKHDWAQTSLIASLVFNPNRKPGTRARKPAEFNPHTARPRGVDFEALREVFGRGAKKKGGNRA